MTHESKYRSAQTTGHILTHNGTNDIPAGAIVGVQYVGRPVHPLLRKRCALFELTYLGKPAGLSYANNLREFSEAAK